MRPTYRGHLGLGKAEGVEQTLRGGFSIINKGPWKINGLRSREGKSTMTNSIMEDGRAMDTEPTAVEPHESSRQEAAGGYR
jgi:hypothetical protein